MAASALCCAPGKSNKHNNETGYEVYTISEDQLRLRTFLIFNAHFFCFFPCAN
ncbi:hypothetical protein CAEBREN_28733 [Caenorhabditis brenneri]|uniref:Uncharacterized protein n=1 Tax=Caenorhabditis brenneri TaxID=135651 RepID=G0P6G4_CAEBE|nr:hypothetical protein CAEBREN_28733 [Caenorhabditis brenneri]